jgi:hypothetical protein
MKTLDGEMLTFVGSLLASVIVKPPDGAGNPKVTGKDAD